MKTDKEILFLLQSGHFYVSEIAEKLNITEDYVWNIWNSKDKMKNIGKGMPKDVLEETLQNLVHYKNKNYC